MNRQNLLKKKESLWLIFLFLGFFLSRLWKILDFPLFSDEAFYLSLAEKVKINPQDFLLPLSTATQPLFIWLVALFHIFIKNLILAGRLVSVFVGFLNLRVLFLLLKRLDLKKEAYLAALFFLFSPFLIAYQRLAMLEGLSLLGISLGVYAAVRLWQGPNLVNSLLFGCLSSFGILTKATAFFTYPLSFLVLVLGWGGERRKGRRLLGFFLLGCLLSFFIYFLISFLAAGNFRLVGLYNFATPAGHLAEGSILEIERIKNNFWRAFLWLKLYFTLPFFGLFVFSSMILFFQRNKWGLFFITWFFIIFCFEILVARTFFPRYLFSLIIPVLVIPAIFLSVVFKNLKRALIIAFLILLPSIFFDYRIIFLPESAPWPGEDRFQFFEDWTSGKGYQEIAFFLSKQAEKEKMVVFAQPRDLAIVILKSTTPLKDKEIIFQEEENLRNPIKKTPVKLFRRYQGKEKYIIRDCHQAIPNDWPVVLVKEVTKSAFCKIRVYQVIEDQLKY